MSDKVEALSPSQYFTRGHDISKYGVNLDDIETPSFKSGNFVWNLPSPSVNASLEDMILVNMVSILMT